MSARSQTPPASSSPSSSRQAELKRELARASPAGLAFVASAGRWQPARHLLAIDERLCAVERGEISRLMIFQPPRSGKSMLVSHFTPPWFLGRNPDKRVILASYGAALAYNWGRKARDVLEEHGEALFDVRVNPASKAVDHWNLAGRAGGMNTAGVGGPITGFGADLLIIDDPLKDAEEASSEVIRAKHIDWWQSTARTRLMAGGAVVLMQCIVASMRVLTGDGRWTKIEDVRPGATVVSLDRDRTGLRLATVTASRLSGHDATLKVETDRLALEVNDRHPFAVLRRDRLRPHADQVEWVQAGELKRGDIVVTAKALPSEYPGTDVLPDGSPVSDTRAWLLGYLLGDGWVTAHRRKRQQGNPVTYAVCCARTKSVKPWKADLDDRVLAALDDWCPNRVYDTGFGYWRADWNAGGRLLVAMGYDAGARGKRIPECAWSWSPALRRAFLKGYAEADGSLQYHGKDTDPVWRIGSASRALLDDARDLALTCGIRPTRVYTAPAKQLQPPNSPQPITLIAHSLALAFTENTAEGRSLLAQPAQHPAPLHIRYERIRAITPGPAKPVYDLTVEGTESFIAEGFAVHNTRWHEGDLAGWLLEDMRAGGDQWEVLSLPAIAEEEDQLGRELGEPLWPEKFPLSNLEETKRALGGYYWQALYQQRPVPAGGALYQRRWFRYFREDPAQNLYWMEPGEGQEPKPVGRDHVYRFVTCDPAFSEKETSDYTALCLWGVTPWMDLLLLDVERVRFDVENLAAAIRRHFELHKPRDIRIERKAYGARVIDELVRQGLPVIPLDADTDKVTRALSAVPRYEAGTVYHRTGADWLEAYERELLSFPAGVHDDQADCFAYAALALPDLQLVTHRQQSIGQTETGGLATAQL